MMDPAGSAASGRDGWEGDALEVEPPAESIILQRLMQLVQLMKLAQLMRSLHLARLLSAMHARDAVTPVSIRMGKAPRRVPGRH